MKKITILFAILALIFTAIPAIAGGGADAEAESEAFSESNNYTTNNSTSYDKRQLPGGVMGGYTIVPPMVDNGNFADNVQFVGDILTVRETYTLRQLSALNDVGDSYTIHTLAYNSMRKQLNNPAKGVKGMDLDTKITISLAVRVKKGDDKGKLIRPKGIDVAFLRGHADDTKSATISLMAGMAIEAMRHGATEFNIVGAGAKKILEAMGWGFQIGTTAAAIDDNKGSAIGTVTGGGFGYGEAKGSYGYEPGLYGWGYFN